MNNAAVIFDALGNDVRRAIVERLAHGPTTVSALASSLPVSRPAVSRHLRVLSDAGLVSHRPEGSSHLYRLEQRGLDPARKWLERFWDDALTRFAIVAENLGSDEDER